VAAGLVLLVTLLLIMGVQQAEWVQNACTTVCLITIVMSIITGGLGLVVVIKNWVLGCLGAWVLGCVVARGIFRQHQDGSHPGPCHHSLDEQQHALHCAIPPPSQQTPHHTCIHCTQGFIYTDKSNWKPFAPFGFDGMFRGASVVFFAYLGFEMMCAAPEEAINAQR